MNDTCPAVDAVYEQMLMSLSGSERVRMVSSMYDSAKELSMAALRKKHPGATEKELRGLIFLHFYADDFDHESRMKIYNRLVGGLTPNSDRAVLP